MESKTRYSHPTVSIDATPWHASQVTFWHGGAPGREVGDLLLPPTQTDLAWTSRAINEASGLVNPNYREDRVYFTTDKKLAMAFAGYWSREPRRHGLGAVYEIEVGEDLIEHDEDFPSVEGLFFQAPLARVVRVERPALPYFPTQTQYLDSVLRETNRKDRHRLPPAGSEEHTAS